MHKNVLSYITLLVVFLSLTLVTACGKKEKPTFKILLRMMPAQYNYYKQEVIPEFEKKHNCKIDIVTFDQSSQIIDILNLEKNKPENDRIAVVKVPFEMTRELVKKGYMSGFRELFDDATVTADEAQYYDFALKLGYVNGKLYYFPRKLETRILVFLKSKVNDAVKNWEKFKPQINELLKAENGIGLPKNYTLEEDPNQWDNFDIFVVGYYWAHTEYNGIKMPRIAHRAKKYLGTALGLIERSYRLGATIKDVQNIKAPKVVDMFDWERVFIKDSIYNPAMWQDLWSGSGIMNGFKDGKVFLADMQQIDCFILHGWEELPEMPGFVEDPNDLGYALLPKGVSLYLKPDSTYQYIGNKKATNGGWWWGIPKTAKEVNLAYEFIKFVTSKEIQAEEVARFGILPVRKDIIHKLPSVFRLGWVGEMYKVSSEQLKINDTLVVPLVENYSELAMKYVNFWNDKLVPLTLKGQIKSKEDIQKLLEEEVK